MFDSAIVALLSCTVQSVHLVGAEEQAALLRGCPRFPVSRSVHQLSQGSSETHTSGILLYWNINSKTVIKTYTVFIARLPKHYTVLPALCLCTLCLIGISGRTPALLL
jgi:hypothetical protein